MAREQENFYRHSTVIVDDTTDAFLLLLDFYLTNQGITLQRFIEINAHYLYHLCFNRYPCCQCPPGTRAEIRGKTVLHQKQMKILFDATGSKSPGHNPGSKSAPHCCYPVSPNLQRKDLDLTLARLLLVNCTSIVPQGSQERKALELLVDYRNNAFAHAKEGKMSGSEYKKSMADIERSLLVLAKVYGKEAETRQRLRDSAKQPYNTTLCQQLQITLLQQCQLEEKIDRFIAEKALPEYLTKDLENIRVVEGNDARLELWTRDGDVIVEWFKGDTRIEMSDKYVMEISGQMHSLIVTNANQNDRGIYTAKFHDAERRATINIQEYFTKNMTKTIDCIEGDNVELSCAVCEANIPAHWTKNGAIIQPSTKYTIKDMGKSHMLSIIQLDMQDAGDYSVTVNNRMRSSLIQVKEYFTKPLSTMTCIEGESVLFECEVLDDNETALWFKDGIEVSTSDKYKVDIYGKLHRLVVNNTKLHDQGEYSVKIKKCVQHSQLIVQEYFTKPLSTMTCIEGESVLFECEVLDDNETALWFKDGIEVSTSDKYKVDIYGKLHRLVVNNTKLRDQGEYSVKIKNCVQHSQLIVQEYFTKPLSTMTCIEGESVLFECEVLDDNETALWFKDGIEISTSDKYKVDIHVYGKLHRLVVNNTKLHDQGEYTVKIKNCVHHSQLIVQEYFTQNMEAAIEFKEGDNVQLSCAVIDDNVPSVWTKNDIVIQQSAKYIIEVIGMMHKLSIIRAIRQDSGMYTVIINNRKRSASVQVEVFGPERKITQEQEYFYRLSTVIVDETKDLFLHLLDFHLTNQGITLQRFIEINAHDVYHLCFNFYPCCQCPPRTPTQTRGSRVLHPPQLDILFYKTGIKLPGHNPRSISAPHCCSPVNPDLQLQDLDFIMARFLLVNFTTIVLQGSPERVALDDLHNCRNKLFLHAKEGKISAIDYQKSMADIEYSFLVLAKIYFKEIETKQRLIDIAKQPFNTTLSLQVKNTLLQTSQLEEKLNRLLAEKSLPEYLMKDLEDIKVVEGCDARLELWTRERGVNAEWFKGDIRIEMSDKYVIRTSGQMHSLIVINADITDRAIYTVKFKDFERSAKIEIEVFGLERKVAQEQENFYRLSTVIVDETKDSLLHLLEVHLTNQGITLLRFMKINAHVVYHLCFNFYPCCQCPPGTRAGTRGSRVLNPPQLDIFFDKTGIKLPGHNPRSISAPHCCSPVNPDLQLQDLDFSLARFLLVNFTTIVLQGSPERIALDDLHNCRNKLFVHSKGKICDSEYQKSMADIERSLIVLAKVYGKEAETKQRLRDIANQPRNTILSLQLQNALLQKSQLEKKLNRLLAEKSLPDTDLHRIVNAKEFKELLSKGSYESFWNRIYLAGACNVGKTTLASLLIGDDIPQHWRSTDGLQIYFGRNGIDLKAKKIIPLSKGQGYSDVFSKVLRGKPSIDMLQSETAAKFQESAAYIAPKLKVPSPKIMSSSHAAVHLSIPNIVPQTGVMKENKISDKREKIDRLKETQKLYTRHKFTSIHQNINDELNKVRKGEYKVEIAPSDLIDFGGQKSYDMTHQLFIQSKGTFTLMFDGRKGLKDPLKEYSQGDVTSESILKHWVDSILTYCGEDDDDILPVLLFVATHRDHLTEDQQSERMAEFKKGLKEMFQDQDHHRRIKYEDIFFINGRDENDSEVNRLKETYVAIAFKQKSWGERMPMAWVPLELQMSEMRANNISIISKDDLVEINKENDDLALTDRQLDQFLRVQHSLGKIMYFEGQGLEEYIVVQPTIMVEILRSFITDEIFWPSDGNLSTVLKGMTETGKIQKADLFRLWSQDEFNRHMPDDKMKRFVAQLLSFLDLLVEPKQRNMQESAGDFYLVPCVAKRQPTATFDDNLHKDNTICLSYKLLKSSIPSALSFKLIGAVMNVWPLKETDKGACLYHKAAFLCIDKSNELHLVVRDNRVLVYLVNEKSKHFISPDIASCVQECLTLTLATALEFYHNSFGKFVSKSKIADMFAIEVGEINDIRTCYVSLSQAQKNPNWQCNCGLEHEAKYPLYWTYDKKDECKPDCTGIKMECFESEPTDKHLVRLAGHIGVNQFKQFVIHLGLTTKDWERIEHKHLGSDVVGMQFDALCEVEKLVKRPLFGDLKNALGKCDCNRHILCQVFREDRTMLDIDSLKLQDIPDNDTLYGLSRHIGNCAIHLGVELDVNVFEIEENMVRYSKDMFDRNYGILTKWKNNPQCNKTIRALMHALWIVDRRGCTFLKKKYDIKN